MINDSEISEHVFMFLMIFQNNTSCRLALVTPIGKVRIAAGEVALL